MHVILYKRHRQECEHKGDKNHRRCRCSVWFEWNINGKQTRQSAKTASWENAQEKARAIERKHLDGETGRTPIKPATQVEEAISLFMASKRGEDLASDTLYRHEQTLERLQDFCTRERISFVKDITMAHLAAWRPEWPYESPLARRNMQERLKAFFRFCHDSGIIPLNPTSRLAAIQIKADEAHNVRPFEPDEYKRILAAIPKSVILPANRDRVRACIQLQRWSGLSIRDAVCLTRSELLKHRNTFRVRTARSKTGVHINNVIPSWLGRELLRLKNGNPRYFFITGDATPKSAVSAMQKMYQRVFRAAKIDGTSHMFRHTFSVELLKAGVDIRKVSKALGHSSVTITERYYAKWNKAQQDILDDDLTRAWTAR